MQEITLHWPVTSGSPKATFLAAAGFYVGRSSEGEVLAVEGYAEFMAARGPALLRTAYLICGDRHQAEDLFQTAMARLLVHWPRVSRDNPEAYVRRTLVNSAINWRQRLLSRERNVAAVPDRPGPDFTDALAARDETWRMLARLPRRQRAVLVLRYYEDLTEAQAAELLGCSVGTIKSQSAKALARLRAEPGPFFSPPHPRPQPRIDDGMTS